MLGLAPGRQGFYNLGNGDGYSVREGIRTCEKVSGKAIPALEKPRRPGDPPRLVAAADRAVKELGWKPKYPKLEDIVATAWTWHKSHPNGYPDCPPLQQCSRAPHPARFGFRGGVAGALPPRRSCFAPEVLS